MAICYVIISKYKINKRKNTYSYRFTTSISSNKLYISSDYSTKKRSALIARQAAEALVASRVIVIALAS